MSFACLRIVLIISLTALISCSTTQANRFHTIPLSPGPTQQWSAKLMEDSGQIEIQFTLTPHSSANLVFKDSRQQHFYSAKINFNDYDCTGGHEGFITYRKGKNEFHSSYFVKPAQWNTVSTLVITWDQQKNLTASLNGENITMALDHKFNLFEINTSSSPIDIKKIFYTQYTPGK